MTWLIVHKTSVKWFCSRRCFKNFKKHVKLNFSSLTGAAGLWPTPIFQTFNFSRRRVILPFYPPPRPKWNRVKNTEPFQTWLFPFINISRWTDKSRVDNQCLNYLSTILLRKAIFLAKFDYFIVKHLVSKNFHYRESNKHKKEINADKRGKRRSNLTYKFGS